MGRPLGALVGLVPVVALALLLALPQDVLARGGGGRSGRGGPVGRGSSSAGRPNTSGPSRRTTSRSRKDQARLRERSEAELRDALLHDAARDRV